MDAGSDGEAIELAYLKGSELDRGYGACAVALVWLVARGLLTVDPDRITPRLVGHGDLPGDANPLVRTIHTDACGSHPVVPGMLWVQRLQETSGHAAPIQVLAGTTLSRISLAADRDLADLKQSLIERRLVRYRPWPWLRLTGEGRRLVVEQESTHPCPPPGTRSDPQQHPDLLSLAALWGTRALRGAPEGSPLAQVAAVLNAYVLTFSRSFTT